MLQNVVDAFNKAVRGLVTVMFAGTICYGFLTRTVSVEVFAGLVGTVVTFWFMKREVDKAAEPVSPAPPTA